MEEGMSGFCIKPRGSGGGGVGGGGNKCGRWNPTSEQVKVLTELFRSGLRTPSTEQIQKISKELSFYGKIESKNVFYWFQNHKARERQKRRRVFVDVDDVDDEPNHHDSIHRHDYKISSAKHFVEVNQVLEPERVIETLQLFPLNSFNESNSDKMRLFAHECKENYAFGSQMDHPPVLDLRLSFL